MHEFVENLEKRSFKKKNGTKVLIGIVGTYLGIIIYCFMGIELAKTSMPAIPRLLIAEVFLTAVTVALFIILKRLYVLKPTTDGLKTEFGCALPSLIISGLCLLSFVCKVVLLDDNPYKGVAAGTIIINFIILLIHSLLVGIAEEGLFRGILFNELFDLWGRNSLKGFYLATVVSAILFGGSHLTNLIKGASFSGVLMQIISAGISGLLYCAIYYRFNNLWVPIFLHGLNDIIGFTQSGMLSGVVSSSEIVTGYNSFALIMSVVELSIALFLLRKKKVEPLLDRE